MNASRGAWCVFACGAMLMGAVPSWAAAQIYVCTDATGKRITSDRPIVECRDRPQEEKYGDGSTKRIVPPTPTADERAAAEEQARQRRVEAERVREAVRRDRNLRARYPNEAAHKKAREGALEDSRQSLRRSEARIRVLAKERKPLLDDAEFYVGKPLPARLKQQLDANDASVRAQEDLIQSGQAEIDRINALFDDELERLRQLWSGVQPGMMGMLPVQPAASAPRKPPVSRASASESR